MRGRKRWTGGLAAAGALAVIAWAVASRRHEHPPRGAAVADSGPVPVAVLRGETAPAGKARDPELPPELSRHYPPGTRVPVQVPWTSSGVECPGGTYLPLLNGVPAAPPIRRSAYLGPVPPVVALLVDDAGYEWYEHADGSTTTTRYCTVIADGVPMQNVQTLHNAALPASAGRVRPTAGGH